MRGWQCRVGATPPHSFSLGAAAGYLAPGRGRGNLYKLAACRPTGLTNFNSVLQKNKIAGAGLDVFEEEPINRDNPLLSLDNVVLTPHAAGSTKESWPRRAIFAFENIKRVFNRKEALSLIKNE